MTTLTLLPLWAQYVLCALLGYLLGTSSMAFYLSALGGVDLQKKGSGNLGASNALMTLGPKAGVLTAVHDIGKAALAVWLVQWLFPTAVLGSVLAGMMSIMGHMYPFWLRFKGGKGFACYLGVILAHDWRVFLVFLAIVVAVVLISDYIVAGTMSTCILYPVYLLLRGDFLGAAILSVATLCMVWKHRENFRRIRQGEEVRVRHALFTKLKK